MLRLLLGIPAFLLSFVWSLFFPEQPWPAPLPPPPAPDPNAPSAESQREGHEVSDANPTTIGLFALSLFLVIFAAMAALGGMYVHLYTKAEAMPVRPAQETFQHGAVARTSIAKDWAAIDALAHERLDGYGWTDRAHGVVRVPIDRAMELVAREGLPARDGRTPDFPAPDQEKLPLMQMETNPNATSFDPH